MPSPPRRVSIGGIVIALFALALFAYAIYDAGAADIQSGLRQIGWGLPIIIAISGVRMLARTLAWRTLMRTPPPAGSMLAASIAGEAVGTLLPLGPLAGEPAKIGYLRSRGPIAEAAAALGLENVFYSLSIAAVIVVGMALLVLTVALPDDLRVIATAALFAMMAIIAAGVYVLVRKPSTTGSFLDRLPSWIPTGGLRTMETKAYAFYASAKGRIGRMLACEALFHVFGLAEVYAVLWLLSGEQPSLLNAFILESAGRVVNVLFRFIPMRVGVDETGAKFVASALGLAPETGVLLALSRKLRVLFWTLIGVGLLSKRGMSLTQAKSSTLRSSNHQL